MFAVALVGGCAREPADPEVLARVDKAEIKAVDLRALEARLPANGVPAPDDHRSNLQTLIDRQILLLEARARGLEQDPQVLDRLAKSESAKLSEVMMKHLFESATATEAEIRQAYDGAWNTQVVTLQVFVPNLEQARQVIGLLRQGRDFGAVGRQYAVDRVLRVPLGAPQGVVYSPYDGPADLVEAVFALPVGGTTGPVQVMGGYVIARVAERRHVELEQIKGKISEWLTNSKKRELRAEYLKQLKAEYNLTFDQPAMDLVLQVLRGESALEGLTEEQRRQPVFTYGEQQAGVEEVVRRVGPAARNWREVTQDLVLGELREHILPVEVVAMDARRQGVDQVGAFRQWRETERERLMLVRLQAIAVGADSLQATEAELEAYYEANKQRYRIPAWARLQELLVEDAGQARGLADRIAAGADMAPLIRQYSVRQAAKDGILTVFGPQAEIYGEAWMNLAMNAPLGELQGPVQTKGGYSLFRVLERQPESYYGMDQTRVKRDVEKGAKAEKERARFNDYLEGLRRQYVRRVRIYQDHLDKLAAPSPADSSHTPS